MGLSHSVIVIAIVTVWLLLHVYCILVVVWLPCLLRLHGIGGVLVSSNDNANRITIWFTKSLTPFDYDACFPPNINVSSVN